MKSSYLALIFFCFVSAANAQTGYYFQTHYSPIENRRDQLHYSIEQDAADRLYFASRQGLLHFDGSNWDLIETPGPTFSIKELDSTVYLAGTYGFGKISNDIYGNFVFSSLNDSSRNYGGITQMEVYGSSLAMTDGLIGYLYTPASQRWEKIESSLPVSAVSVFGPRLMAVNSDTSFVLRGEEALPASYHENGPWLLWERSPADVWVGASSKNELFVIKDNAVVPIGIEDDGYLAESRIVSLSWVSENQLAAGTLRGGVVFLDFEKNKLDQIVNFHTGLPDNETQLLFPDKDDALWVAHSYGFTRISPNIPFKSYNYYPGLDGTLYTSLQFADRVFAGTNLGLFYLDEVKNFEEVVYYIKKNPDTQLTELENRPAKKDGEGGLLSFLKFNKGENKAAEENKAVEEKKEEPQKEEPSDEGKKKGGLFSFLKKNKSKEAEVQEVIEPVVAKKPEALTKRSNQRKSAKTVPPKPQLVKRVKKELQSITFVYKKVMGVEGRISQLIPLNDTELLAAGLAGVFIIKGEEATQIHSEAARRVYYSASQNLILVSTYKGGLLTVNNIDGKWTETVLLENLDDFIQHIFEDRMGRIWLCTSRKLYWTKIENDSLADAGEIKLRNDYLDPVVGVDDEELGVVFMHSKGFFRLNDKALEPFEWRGMQTPARYINSREQLLVSDGRFWHRMGRNLHESNTFQFLNVFEDIISADFERDGDLWIVTADNNFYRIDHTKAFEADYHPFLKQIRSVNNQLLPIGKELTVDQENSSLSFFFNQAEYSGVLKVEYRYRLLGLNGEWSEWSPNNSNIQFSYLPPDQYELQVETRNSFGAVKSLEPVYFKVVPPYWKRPWFYAAELFVFALLLFISSRLTRSERMHLQVVNRLLAFLTIIMIIEFIQTLVESNFETDSSPVISFFLQVSVAFCLLPLESFMRKRLSTKHNQVDELVQSHVSRLRHSIIKPKLKKT